MTGTVIVQLAEAGTDMPETPSELPPLVMFTVQPQVFVEGDEALLVMP